MSFISIVGEGDKHGPYLTITLVTDGGIAISWKHSWYFRIRGWKKGKDLPWFVWHKG